MPHQKLKNNFCGKSGDSKTPDSRAGRNIPKSKVDVLFGTFIRQISFIKERSLELRSQLKEVPSHLVRLLSHATCQQAASR